jgi:hypothetical protein
MSERTPEEAAFASYKEALQDAVTRAQRLSTDYETRSAMVDEHMEVYSLQTQALVNDLQRELSRGVEQDRAQIHSRMEHSR